MNILTTLRRSPIVAVFAGFILPVVIHSGVLAEQPVQPLQSSPVLKDVNVFFDADRVPEMRKRFASDPLFADLREELLGIDRTAERRFMKSEVRYNDQLYDIPRVGNLAQQMAFLYLFTGDRDAAKLAKECIECLMRFPKWDYFLDGGTKVIGLQRSPNSALAVAIVVELLGDLVNEKERTQWLRVMGERGTEPCFRSTYGMRYPESVAGWGFDTASTYLRHRPDDRGLDLSRWPIILNTINLKAVPASALAMSALVYRRYFGETADTKRWLEQAMYSVSTFRDIYAPDGSYNEGVSYANYTTLHLVQAITALKRAGVADMGDLLNWPGYVCYLREMTSPTIKDPTNIVNFSDAGNGASAAVPFWVATHTHDRQAQWVGQTLAYNRDVWSLLWYDPSIAPEPPVPGPFLWHSDLDWMVGRTGYGVDDLVLAMRSGGPFNHEHADRNSIILKCFGETLVADPKRPPYNFKDPAWIMRLTGGHSAVLIDGKGHQYVDGTEGTNSSQARAKVVRSGERKGYMFWTSDATPAYQLVQPDVSSITRTVVMLDDVPAVLVLDKVIKKSEPSTVQARFFCYNNDGEGRIAADASGFTIIRPSAQLRGITVSNGDVASSTATLPIPDKAGKGPAGAANTGGAKKGVTISATALPIPEDQAKMHPFVEVGTTAPRTDVFLLTVLLPERTPGGFASAEVRRESADGPYRVSIRNGNSVAECRVFDTGEIPEFEVVKKEQPHPVREKSQGH
jgi:Heparinase II/III-like protein